jgi:tRNA-splicing ligase RtcB
MITGKDLIAWGYKPGPWFPAAIEAANAAQAAGGDARAAAAALAPPPVETVGLRQHGDLAHHLNIRAEDPDEVENVAPVERHMRELMRVPTIVAGAVMPDACPAGAAPGTIPVGGVVAAKDAIHPGMHSADICCSMAVTMFGDVNPTATAAADGRAARSCAPPTRS